MPGVRYNFKAVGADDVKRSIEEISQKMKQQGNTVEQQIQNQHDLRKAVNLKLREDKLQRDVYLAQHPTILRLNQSLGTMSRILHTVTIAQQAWNIAQLVSNQKGAESVKVANELRQAQRAYDLALQQGKSGEELANLAEDLDSYESFKSPHILTPSLSDKSNFALGTGDLFVTGTAGVTSIILKDISEDMKYVLGVLNSRLISYYILKHSPVFQGGYHKFSSNYLKKVPLRRIDFSRQEEKDAHKKIVELVSKAIELHAKLRKLGDKLTDERDELTRKIRDIDNEIDATVYRLYGITENEKKIIEEGIK